MWLSYNVYNEADLSSQFTLGSAANEQWKIDPAVTFSSIFTRERQTEGLATLCAPKAAEENGFWLQ